ncbi:MAG: hypothetical protein M3O70_12070 [Actinomycetota bacterium]|nr:hypothetical protein [Actinomycetota bacterium]
MAAHQTTVGSISNRTGSCTRTAGSRPPGTGRSWTLSVAGTPTAPPPDCRPDCDAPYADKLLFDIPSEDTTDSDESVVASDLLDQVKEKAEDLLGVGSRMVADVWLA